MYIFTSQNIFKKMFSNALETANVGKTIEVQVSF